MKSISLKLDEDILMEAEIYLQQLRTSRNKYINEAVAFYNQHQKRKLIEQQLAFECELLAEDSMKVLKEFEILEDEL
ncbi:MAG: hypothetical protein AAF798_01455 [Bacteroidota bacterium]